MCFPFCVLLLLFVTSVFSIDVTLIRPLVASLYLNPSNDETSSSTSQTPTADWFVGQEDEHKSSKCAQKRKILKNLRLPSSSCHFYINIDYSTTYRTTVLHTLNFART